MSDWETFSFDPITGIHVEIKQEPVGPDHTKIHMRRTYIPVQELFDLNAERRAENAGARWGDGAVAASIPMNLYFEKFAEAKQAGDEKYVKRLLNDSDYSKFRTKEGNL
jgi:hypothetical protein